jgi:hypothetical protein
MTTRGSMPPPPNPPPPLIRRRAARPHPAPAGNPHRHLAPHALGSTPSTSSWEAFFQGGPVPAGSAPTAAGQRRASAPSGDLQADGRVSFADIVRLGHLNSARGRPPPSYQPKRAFTAPRSNCAVRPRPAATAARNGPPVSSEDLGWTYVTRRKDRSCPSAPNGFRRFDARRDDISWRSRGQPHSSRPPTAALQAFNQATLGRCFNCLGRGHRAVD